MMIQKLKVQQLLIMVPLLLNPFGGQDPSLSSIMVEHKQFIVVMVWNMNFQLLPIIQLIHQSWCKKTTRENAMMSQIQPKNGSQRKQKRKP